MELLLRGKYLLTSATESRVLTDAAVLITGDRVAEVGDWPTLRGQHPEARVVGNGRQLISRNASHASRLNVSMPPSKCNVTIAGFNSSVTVHIPSAA